MGLYLILVVVVFGFGMVGVFVNKDIIVVCGDCLVVVCEVLLENGGMFFLVEFVGNECVIMILVQNSGECLKKKVVYKLM